MRIEIWAVWDDPDDAPNDSGRSMRAVATRADAIAEALATAKARDSWSGKPDKYETVVDREALLVHFHKGSDWAFWSDRKLTTSRGLLADDQAHGISQDAAQLIDHVRGGDGGELMGCGWADLAEIESIERETPLVYEPHIGGRQGITLLTARMISGRTQHLYLWTSVSEDDYGTLVISRSAASTHPMGRELAVLGIEEDTIIWLLVQWMALAGFRHKTETREGLIVKWAQRIAQWREATKANVWDLTFGEAIEAVQAWETKQRMVSPSFLRVVAEGETVVLRMPGGWHVVELTNDEAIASEGHRMNNFFADEESVRQLRRQGERFFSLRRASGEPLTDFTSYVYEGRHILNEERGRDDRAQCRYWASLRVPCARRGGDCDYLWLALEELGIDG